MPAETIWVTRENRDEIAKALAHIQHSLSDLLELTGEDEYPVEILVADRCFVFDDRKSLEGVIATIQASLDAFDRAA